MTITSRSPPPMMSPFVEVLVPLGRGLDVKFAFLICGKEVPPQNSLASRKEDVTDK